MKPHLFKKIILSIILLSFSTPFFVKAIALPNPLEWDTIEEVIEGIIDFIFWAAVAIAPLMIIITGAYFLTSGGNPEKVRKAKDIILWTVVGLTIVLLAKGIISVVKQIIGG